MRPRKSETKAMSTSTSQGRRRPPRAASHHLHNHANGGRFRQQARRTAALPRWRVRLFSARKCASGAAAAGGAQQAVELGELERLGEVSVEARGAGQILVVLAAVAG